MTVTPLQRLIAEAVVLGGGEHECAVLGHRWRHVGGRNCGCAGRAGCSVPVHKCDACGDCDYGDNDEAREILMACEIERESL